MSRNNGQSAGPARRPRAPRNPAANGQHGVAIEVEFEVAPANGRGIRLVIARVGNVEHRDQFNVNQAAARTRFLNALQRLVGHSLPDDLDQRLVARAEEADAMVREELERRRQEDASQPTVADYEMRAEGIFWLQRTRDGVVPVQLTNFQAQIVEDVSADDGVEIRRTFTIEASLGRPPLRFAVPAAAFASLSWATEHLGAGAVVFAGPAIKDHARVAMQLLSGDVPQHHVYAHLGWRQFGTRWAYLHAGGATGADGLDTTVSVALGGVMDGFRLPPSPSGAELVAAVRASLALLDVAPGEITVPLLAATYRAPLGLADLTVHLAGASGQGKSAIAALAQQHYGAGLDARNLPASWCSTANTLVAQLFVAKDALLVVDDFAPAGSKYDVQKFHRDADRVIRAQGNNSGRGRMRPDGSLRPVKPPRCLTLSTGEDIPRGQSIRARMVILETSRGSMNWANMTVCQQAASDGLFAAAMAGYVSWLAANHEELVVGMPDRVRRYLVRGNDESHRRTSMNFAHLAVGWETFIRFAVHCGALSDHDGEQMLQRGLDALGRCVASQTQHQSDNDPARRFLELLEAAISSGKAHLAAPHGGHPQMPQAWGWRSDPNADWRPHGDRIGWVDGDQVYLEPEAAFVAAQQMAGEGGDSITVSCKTLHKRLHEGGCLASTEPGRLLIRRIIEGARRYVLHIRAEHLHVLEPGPGDLRRVQSAVPRTRPHGLAEAQPAAGR